MPECVHNYIVSEWKELLHEKAKRATEVFCQKCLDIVEIDSTPEREGRKRPKKDNPI